ncbi:MAG TPA: PLP-dependent aminotransferase family protein [Magnetovibrio sp.]
MSKWIPSSDTFQRPVYLSLAKSIENDIRSGALSFGDQLPTHRDLAHTLGISVQTVSRAYVELARRNLISSEVGRGSYVRATASEVQPPYIPDDGAGGVIDLSILKPVISVRHEEEMRKVLADLSTDLSSQMVNSFRPNIAHEGHRESSVEWLKLCGLDVMPSSVLVTDGATPALTTALITAAREGTTLLVEDITHHTILPLARYLGIKVVPLAMDAMGALPASMDAACASHKVCAVYLGPNGENPWGYVMSLERRRQIVEVARRHDVYIIENGVFGPLPKGQIPPLASLAPERTFYATSFTKCVMPGLRTGYLVAPDQLMPSVLNRHLILNWMANPMTAEIASRWIASGLAKKLVDWQRSALAERHKLVVSCLPKKSYRGGKNGLHIWVDIPQGWSEAEFVSHARLRGVAVAPSEPFTATDHRPGASVRISVGSASYDELARGLNIIAGLLVSTPEPSLLLL